MKIKSISCEQFAGVRDRNVSFSDGLNVIYGKNESGKSTLVHLLSQTLFQNARLDGRSDKEFFDLYFPAAKKDSAVKADFVDGRIILEDKNGEYKLQKEWNKNSKDTRCRLTTPDSVISNQDDINRVLHDVLLYGKGVYRDVLFSSQRNTDVALQTLLDASKKSDAKQEITNVVSQAFAETDGISMDAIGDAINAKIDEIAGKHWDFEREAPVRGRAGRWQKERGKILDAYYALEDANAVLSEIDRRQADADRTANAYTAQEHCLRQAQNAYTDFDRYASALIAQSEQKKNLAHIQQELVKASNALVEWPKLTAQLGQAKALRTEKNHSEALEKYSAAKAIKDTIAALQQQVENQPCPTDAEIKQAQSLQETLPTLKNQLCGMNITAAIKLLNNHSVEITSVLTGKAVDVSDGLASITEAVNITVPGVLAMQLSPADVDAAAVKAQIAEQEKALADLFDKYQVKTFNKLRELKEVRANMQKQVDLENQHLSVQLGATAFETLEAAATAITEAVRAKEDIARDIDTLCGSTNLDVFITRNETKIAAYADAYSSISDLREKASALKAEQQKAEASLSQLERVPAEYLNIADPAAHRKLLAARQQAEQDRLNSALTEKTTAASKLESYQENLPDDPQEAAEKAKQTFEETKSLLAHWQHIQQVFLSEKEKIHSNPMQDIADRFAHYLSVISSGKVASVFPEANKLDMNIYSDDKPLDYGKLSEGTKETVSLAFRLAVLDHLFPDGGGVIVFDDPFTDMDAERTAQSCALIQDCAQRHQVIFLTCKDEYAAMLGGNEIRM